MEIENCVALVTGANRGLGKTFVEALLDAGAAKIYAAARDPTTVMVRDGRVVPVELDITQEDQVRAAVAACPDVDLLINNAGIVKMSPVLAEGAQGALREEMEVNVFGTLHMVNAFAPVLGRSDRSTIVNILSVTSLIAYPHNATYAATKQAGLALTDGLRVQVRGQGTQVIGVFAGYIDTDMAANIDAPKTSPQQVVDRTLVGIREGRAYVHADERAEAAWATTRTDPTPVLTMLQDYWDATQAVAAKE